MNCICDIDCFIRTIDFPTGICCSFMYQYLGQSDIRVRICVIEFAFLNIIRASPSVNNGDVERGGIHLRSLILRPQNTGYSMKLMLF